MRLIVALAAAVCLSAMAWVHSGRAWASLSTCHAPVEVPLPSAAAVLPGSTPPSLVLPAEQLGGVQRYSLPGEFPKVPPATDAGPRAGVLHIYLKALRWPVSRAPKISLQLHLNLSLATVMDGKVCAHCVRHAAALLAPTPRVGHGCLPLCFPALHHPLHRLDCCMPPPAPADARRDAPPARPGLPRL